MSSIPISPLRKELAGDLLTLLLCGLNNDELLTNKRTIVKNIIGNKICI